MYLLCHGGHCCGIKHIYGFHSSPGYELPSIPKPVNSPNLGAAAQSRSPALNFFNEAAPMEPALARLDRLLAYCQKRQPGGLIEVTLIKYQKENWGKLLEDRGFVIVSQFTNSNSANTIWVYHKINVEVEDDEVDD